MKKLLFIVGIFLIFLTGCTYPIEIQENQAEEKVPQVEATDEVDVAGVVDVREVDLEVYSKEVLKLVNEYRLENGLNELVWDDQLAEVAKIRAPEVVVQWSHIRPDGTKYVDILDDMRYPSPLVGENLGRYQTTPEEVVQMWKDSPGHNANLLGDFTKIGIKTHEEKGRLYWVQIFAK